MRVLTTLLSKEEVGNYYLLLTVITLLNFVFFHPIRQYYSRHLIQWKRSHNLSNATVTLLLLRLIGGILSLLASFVIYKILGYGNYSSLFTFLTFIFLSLVAENYEIFVAAVNTLGDRIRFTVFMVLTLTFGLVLSILIVSFVSRSAMGWLYGLIVSQIVSSFLLYKYVVKDSTLSLDRIKSSIQKGYVTEVSLFIIPVTLTLFLQWGQSQFYRFIVETKYSLQVLATIGIGLSISGAVFSAVEGLATQFYNPIYLRKITHASKEERARQWNELADYMLPIYVILMVFVIILSPYLTSLFVASKFYHAYVYTMFGAMIEFFRVVTNLVYKVSLSEVKSFKTVFPYSLGFLFTLCSLFFCDFSERLWMIPLMVVVGNLIIFITLFYSMKKLLDIKINYFSILKTIFLVSPLCFVLLFTNTQQLLQCLFMLGFSGVYLLLLLYLIVEKKVLRVRL